MRYERTLTVVLDLDQWIVDSFHLPLILLPWSYSALYVVFLQEAGMHAHKNVDL